MINSNHKKSHTWLKIAIALACILAVGYIDGNTKQTEDDYCKSNPHDWTFCNYR